MSKTFGIPHAVPMVIFRMPLIEIAVVANATFDDDDIWNIDPAGGDFHSSAVSCATFIIRAGHNTTRGEAGESACSENLDFCFHKSELTIVSSQSSPLAIIILGS